MVVIDTSVVFKWIAIEEQSNPALTLLSKILTQNEEVFAPDILLYELSNVLATKTKLNIKEIKLAWQLFRSFPIRIIAPSPGFIEKSIQFAKNYSISVYDASYVVLAKEKRCQLITADQKLVDRVNLSFVKSI